MYVHYGPEIKSDAFYMDLTFDSDTCEHQINRISEMFSFTLDISCFFFFLFVYFPCMCMDYV